MSIASARANEDPAQDASRLLTRLGLILLFVVSLTAPILAGQTIYVMLPVGTALMLVGAALSPATREKFRPFLRLLASPPSLGALALVAWTALSLSWTPFGGGPEERFLKDAATLLLVAVAAGFLPARTRICNLNLLPIGLGVAVVALAAMSIANQYYGKERSLEELIDGDALARSGVGIALLMWPAAGALAMRGRWRYAAVLLAVSAAATLLSGAPNAIYALSAGAIGYGLSYGGRARRGARELGWTAAAAIALSPIAALAIHLLIGASAPEALRPLEVWGRIVAQAGLHNLLGHGFGAAHFGLFGGYLDAMTPRSLMFQIWFDLGVLGAAAFAVMTWQAFLRMAAARHSLSPFLIAGVASGLLIAFTGPAAEQLWAFTLAGLDVIAYVLVMRGQFRKKRPMVVADTQDRPPAVSSHVAPEAAETR